VKCSDDWRAPFLPESTGDWANYPALEDLFLYNGCGVQAKRVWVISPDSQSLFARWQELVNARVEAKENLFHATLRDGKPADRHIRSIVNTPLPGFDLHLTPLIDEKGPCVPPMRYAFRSFDRQWIIPDPRVITQPNARLWEGFTKRQVFLTAPSDRSPTQGPAVTFTGLIPDLHHYNGRGGRAFPLWDSDQGNVSNELLGFLSKQLHCAIAAEDVMAYIAAVAAHPGFASRYRTELVKPGLRIPITSNGKLFADAVELGKVVIWLHTFGERFTDSKKRPFGPPRLPKDKAPRIPKEGAIPWDSMPDEIEYDASKQHLIVGGGYIENVTPAMWSYEVSGKQVILQWFSYRKKDRARPIIGDRRKPSELGEVQPDHWLAEYTAELLNVLHVLGRLIELEPEQDGLLKRIVEGPTISVADLTAAGAMAKPVVPDRKRTRGEAETPSLFEAG